MYEFHSLQIARQSQFTPVDKTTPVLKQYVEDELKLVN